MDRSTVRWRRHYFRKCKAWPKEALYCDGCKSKSSKCPLRHKARDDRHKEKTGVQRYVMGD